MNALVQAHAVRKSFARTEALRGVSVELGAGETVAVTGPSGSGKSTLLLCLAGILRPEAGEVVYDGQRLDGLAEADRTRLRRREMGIVLQFGQLVPELTAAQNVARLALPRARGWSGSGPTTSPTGSRPSCRVARPSEWRSPAHW
jgi:putative ABC transport system ATP-binding protein